MYADTLSTMNAVQVLFLLEEMITKDGPSAVAAKLGVSRQYLHDVRNGDRKPGPKILAGLGVTKEIRYVSDNRPFS
jgi:hypothetical protein